MNSMKLLLIDDEPDVMLSLKDAIEPAGHECVMYQNPLDAIQRFKIDHFDVVITDYKMPQMDGIRVLRSIQSTKPGFPVIILTAFADTPGAIAAVNTGAYAFFQKPVDIKKIFKTLAVIERATLTQRLSAIQIQRLTGENKELMREVHSRLNTNLQFLYSLLRLEEDKITDPAARAQLSKTFARIRLFSMVYKQCHDQLDNPGFQLTRFISEYLDALWLFLDARQRGIRFEQNLHPVSVKTELAVAWGLVIHETVSNAVMHAFTESHQGLKSVQLTLQRMDDNRIKFAVKDNGVGMPKDWNLERASTVGLFLVSSIVENQLGGKVTLQNDQGTSVQFSIPA
jgi:two-component sensor histidine kinase